MLIDVRDRVAKLMAAKKSADEIKAAKPLADLDARWGEGMIKADLVIEMAMKAAPAPGSASDKGKGKHKGK
jgi:hypothetical protein